MTLFVQGPRGFFSGVCEVNDEGTHYKHHIEWPVRSGMHWRCFDNLDMLIASGEWQRMMPEVLRLPAGV